MSSLVDHSGIIAGPDYDAAQAAANAANGKHGKDIDTDQLFVTQHWDKYTSEHHAVWHDLYDQRWDKLEQQASRTFINGLKAINLTKEHVPRLFGADQPGGGSDQGPRGINDYLLPLTGWQSRAVPGYLPAPAFFACLSQRKFPTTITVRPRDKMNYLPEPDIFHDVFGHVPLHADPTFAEFLQTYGKAAVDAGPQHETALARLFWFTVEFGLIHEEGRLKTYGSGLISSPGESEHALNAPEGSGPGQVERRKFDLDRIIETDFEIDHFQPILYVLDSFDQLLDAMTTYAARVTD